MWSWAKLLTTQWSEDMITRTIWGTYALVEIFTPFICYCVFKFQWILSLRSAQLDKLNTGLSKTGSGRILLCFTHHNSNSIMYQRGRCIEACGVFPHIECRPVGGKKYIPDCRQSTSCLFISIKIYVTTFFIFKYANQTVKLEIQV